MSTIFDIIMAALIGGILLLSMLSASDITGEAASMLNGDLFVQQTLISVVQIVEGEVRNMGYNVDKNVAAIVNAQDTAIGFLEDINLDGNIETVRYFTGPVSELKSTQNDSDRFLYRQVNSDPKNAIGVVTRFQLRYFTQGEADTLTQPIDPLDFMSIKIVEITVEVQNPYAEYRPRSQVKPGERNALYSSSMWRQTRLASQNLNR